jgi:hypothetical protein
MDKFSTIILMNINIINAPTILIEEGTKAVTQRSIFFFADYTSTKKRTYDVYVCNSKSDDRDSQVVDG